MAADVGCCPYAGSNPILTLEQPSRSSETADAKPAIKPADQEAARGVEAAIDRPIIQVAAVAGAVAEDALKRKSTEADSKEADPSKEEGEKKSMMALAAAVGAVTEQSISAAAATASDESSKREVTYTTGDVVYYHWTYTWGFFASRLEGLARRCVLSTDYQPRWSWVSLIMTRPEGGSLYLGGLPEHSVLEDIQTLKIKAVVSLVNPFEKAFNLCVTPIQDQEWKDRKIEVLSMPTRDAGVVKMEDLKRGAEFIKRFLENKENVLVHCKAGVGRSAQVVLGHLTINENMSIEAGHDLVQKQRPGVDLKSKKDVWANFLQLEAECKKLT